MITDYEEPLDSVLYTDLFLFIHLAVFLHLLPSHTVQILEESAARPRSLELQPRGQVYPVLLLQEHCPLHH